jgi:hypothetical protein
MGFDNHVVVSHKLCGFQGRVGGHVAVMKEQCGKCSNFLLRSPGKPITDPNSVCELMDCSAMVFVDECLNVFNIFCHFVGALSS